MAFQHAITINEAQEKFLRENSELSLSKIAQQAIEALMHDYNRTDLKGLLEAEKVKQARIHGEFEKIRGFLEKKGLIDDYFNSI